MARFHLILLALVACSKTTSSPEIAPKPVPASDVSVELSGVTLADDCGEAGQAPPPVTKPDPKDSKDAKVEAKQDPNASQTISAGACADITNCHGPTQPPCQATSMQLSLRAPADAKAATIHVTKVELLDGGKVVDVLTARKPSKWADSSYVTWDEAIAAGQTLATSYMLSAPSWDKLTQGRYNAHNKVFNLRVTVTINNAEKTIEKQSIQPAIFEPAVST